MPKRKGAFFNCIVCGEQFYRQPSHIRRGITKTCGKTECKSAASMGENNPFWGKTHTEEVRGIIAHSHITHPRGKPGPKKGSKRAPEVREALSSAMRKRWKENRDVMLTYGKQGKNKPRHDLLSGPRHRVRFTGVQKKLWLDKQCFYCQGEEDLVLDHIIPASCGGTNIRSNAQTLCQDCNRWKMRFVDTPLYFATLGRDRG
jgi:5-methylcytosine-specific restriction endonuclease McrA